MRKRGCTRRDRSTPHEDALTDKAGSKLTRNGALRRSIHSDAPPLQIVSTSILSARPTRRSRRLGVGNHCAVHAVEQLRSQASAPPARSSSNRGVSFTPWARGRRGPAHGRRFATARHSAQSFQLSSEHVLTGRFCKLLVFPAFAVARLILRTRPIPRRTYGRLFRREFLDDRSRSCRAWS